MVIGYFPLAKLSVLLLKQISKPLSNYIKDTAYQYPLFKKYVCLPPAQLYNWCEVQAKTCICKFGPRLNIPILNEAQTVELGANLLGEAILLVVMESFYKVSSLVPILEEL